MNKDMENRIGNLNKPLSEINGLLETVVDSYTKMKKHFNYLLNKTNTFNDSPDLLKKYKSITDEMVKDKVIKSLRTLSIKDWLSELITFKKGQEFNKLYNENGVSKADFKNDREYQDYLSKNYVKACCHRINNIDILEYVSRDHIVNTHLIKNVSENILYEISVIIFNVYAHVYNLKNNTNVKWLNTNESKMWLETLNGGSNEWSFVLEIINNLKDKEDDYFKNKAFYEIHTIMNEIKNKKVYVLDKGLELSNETFNFLSKHACRAFDGEYLENYFSDKILAKKFKDEFDYFYVSTKVNNSFNEIENSLANDNSDKNFRMLMKNSSFYWIGVSLRNLSQKLNPNSKLLKFIDETVCKVESLYEKRALLLNAKGYHVIIESKNYAIEHQNKNEDFKTLSWVKKEIGNVEVDFIPVYFDDLSLIEQKKIQRKVNLDSSFRKESVYIYKVNKYDVQKYHLKNYNKSISVNSVSANVKKRFESFDKDNTVSEWIKSFGMSLKEEDVFCYFYIKESNGDNELVYEDIVNDVLKKAFLSKFMYGKKSKEYFDLYGLKMIEESRLMKNAIQDNKAEFKTTEMKKKVTKF